MTVQFFQRGANANGQPDPEQPPPAAPAAPFPGEPGDVPVPADPNLQPVGEPGAPPAPETDDPGPGADPLARDPVMARLIQELENRVEDVVRLRDARSRLELGFVASLISCGSVINFTANACGKLNAEDWLAFPDLAHDVHRNAQALAAQLEPICAALKARTPERRFAVVS